MNPDERLFRAELHARTDGVAPKTLDCTYLPMTYAIGRDHAPCGFGEISDSDAFVYARAWLMRAFLAWDDNGKL